MPSIFSKIIPKKVDAWHSLRSGQILNERFKLHKLLGSGGMGEVFAAINIETGAMVAIKFLQRRLFKKQSALWRLRREAEISQSLPDPRLIKIYSYSDSPRPHIVMERLRGQPLNQYVRKNNPQIIEILELGQQICSILSVIHAHGIIHRDLKPSNFFVHRSLSDGQLKLKLFDFGLASWAGHPELSSPHKRTKPLGTCNYMAPEQANFQESDARSDIYSLGTIIYKYTAGRLPFCIGSRREIIQQQIYAPVERPSAFNPNIPAELEALLMRVLKKDPRERPQSAEEFGAELGELIEILKAKKVC